MAGRTAVRIVGDAVGVGVLAGKETGAARRAQRRSDEGIAEGYAFGGDTVEVGGEGERMARAVKFIPAEVVHQDNYDVGPGGLGTRQRQAAKASHELSSRLHSEGSLSDVPQAD